MVIFFNLSPTSSHLYPLQVENCDSNSRLVVDDDNDNFKFRLERVQYGHRPITLACFHVSGKHDIRRKRLKSLARTGEIDNVIGPMFQHPRTDAVGTRSFRNV